MRCLSTPAREAHPASVRTLGSPSFHASMVPACAGCWQPPSNKSIQRGVWGCVETPNHHSCLSTRLLKPQTTQGAAPMHNQESDHEQPPFRATWELERFEGLCCCCHCWRKQQEATYSRSEENQVAWAATHSNKGGTFARQARTDSFCRENRSRDRRRSSNIQLTAAGEPLCPCISDELQRQLRAPRTSSCNTAL